jgi:hypothetical protein
VKILYKKTFFLKKKKDKKTFRRFLTYYLNPLITEKMVPKILDLSTQTQKLIAHASSKFDENQHGEDETIQKEMCNETFKPKIRWLDLIVQLILHTGFLYGFYYLVALKATFYTYVWCE